MDKLTEYIILKDQILSEVFDPISAISVGLVASLPVLYMTLKNIKDTERERIKRKCSKYKGKENKKCRYTMLLKMRQTFLSKISAYKSKCPQQKNPKKCYDKLNSVEQRLKRQIPQLKSKIASL